MLFHIHRDRGLRPVGGDLADQATFPAFGHILLPRAQRLELRPCEGLVISGLMHALINDQRLAIEVAHRDFDVDFGDLDHAKRLVAHRLVADLAFEHDNVLKVDFVHGAVLLEFRPHQGFHHHGKARLPLIDPRALARSGLQGFCLVGPDQRLARGDKLHARLLHYGLQIVVIVRFAHDRRATGDQLIEHAVDQFFAALF